MSGNDSGTELCVAVFLADAIKVEELLAKGVDVNSVGDRRVASVANQSPLWTAVHRGGMEQSGDWKDFCDALHDLGIAKEDYAAKRARHVKIVEILIRAGANLEQRSHGSTPLRGAVSYIDIDLVRLLLRNGANPSAETFSPLSKLAKRQGRKRLPGYWNTVLHEAVMRNSLPIVQELVAAGADLNRTDHEGKTPLNIAREKKYEPIVNFLEEAASGRVASGH